MPPQREHRRSGFTLVELMVAIAILALIVVVVAQIVATASKVTTINNNHIDANSQARAVFDRMADDFARMLKRSDVDSIFCKAPGNDTLFFFTEASSYFDGNSFSSPTNPDPGYPNPPSPEKNSVSLVGYRVNNGSETSGTPTSGGTTYYQLERLGRSLSWDTQLSNNPVTFLTYPAPGIYTPNVDQDYPSNGYYSTAYFDTTLYGSYSSGSGNAPSLVGTLANYFNDGADDSGSITANPYRVIGSQVFRFEFSFQLRDGTQAVIPIMAPSTSNGIPSANLTANAPPSPTNDSTATATISNTTAKYAVGSRWYDKADQIGYICTDATAGAAVWREIGIKDIAAVVVTLAVIDKQGLVYVNNAHIDMAKLASAFTDVTGTGAAQTTTPANVVQTWTSALTAPSAGAKSAASTASGIPQEMVSQLRIYQRYFYINNL